jgi:hypothetical protein
MTFDTIISLASAFHPHQYIHSFILLGFKGFGDGVIAAVL